jgi:hypothetical protein
MTTTLNALQRWVYLVAAFAVLNACTSSNQPAVQIQKDSQEATHVNPDASTAALYYQGDLRDVDGLVEQSKQKDPSLKQTSQSMLETAREAQADDDWGAATKLFGDSVAFMPNNDALLGYATAQAMTNVLTTSPQETLKTRLRTFQDAIDSYQVAIEFSKRTNQTLTTEQKQLAEANIACLEAFLAAPDPKKPTCELVANALKVSNIQ